MPFTLGRGGALRQGHQETAQGLRSANSPILNCGFPEKGYCDFFLKLVICIDFIYKENYLNG